MLRASFSLYVKFSVLIFEFEWHLGQELWLLRGFIAAPQRLEDGENGRKSAKMGAFQMVHCHIGMVPPHIWLSSQAPWDIGGLTICLLRAQWLHHHHPIRPFCGSQGLSCSSQLCFPGAVRISLASLGESSLLSASSSL